MRATANVEMGAAQAVPAPINVTVSAANGVVSSFLGEEMGDAARGLLSFAEKIGKAMVDGALAEQDNDARRQAEASVMGMIAKAAVDGPTRKSAVSMVRDAALLVWSEYSKRAKRESELEEQLAEYAGAPDNLPFITGLRLALTAFPGLAPDIVIRMTAVGFQSAAFILGSPDNEAAIRSAVFERPEFKRSSGVIGEVLSLVSDGTIGGAALGVGGALVGRALAGKVLDRTGRGGRRAPAASEGDRDDWVPGTAAESVGALGAFGGRLAAGSISRWASNRQKAENVARVVMAVLATPVLNIVVLQKSGFRTHTRPLQTAAHTGIPLQDIAVSAVVNCVLDNKIGVLKLLDGLSKFDREAFAMQRLDASGRVHLFQGENRHERGDWVVPELV